MPLVTTDPLKQVLSGILNGYGVADMIRGRAMQEARLLEDQKRAEQDAQLKDINIRSLLSKITRPVDEAGMVPEKVTLPDIGGVPQETLDAGTFDYRRKAQSPITYRSPSGEVIRGELLSPEDQIQQQMREKAAMAGVELDSWAKRKAIETELGKVDIPGAGRVDPKAVPFYTAQANNAARASEGSLNRQNQMAVATTTAKTRKEVAEMNVKAATERTIMNNISRERAARISSTTTADGKEDTPKVIAQSIAEGKQPPVLTGLYRLGGPVRAELARQGYDLSTAQRDWTAVNKHIATLNGAQQERLRQAVTFTYDSLDIIDNLYKEWKDLGKSSGFKDFNRAQLAISKKLPGRAGEVAQNLEAQINDLTAELGTVYKGGNSSTDESLKLAAANLKAEWNPQTFERAMKQIRQNLQIRKNSIYSSEAVGVSKDSPYTPKPAAGGAPAPAAATHRFNPQTGKIEAIK